MTMVLDASMAIAWLLKRRDQTEAKLASKAFDVVIALGAVVPLLWYSEIGNVLLLAERQRVISAQDSAEYLAGLALWEIVSDSAKPADNLNQVMNLGRLYGLTAYDATYLELAMRRGGSLATFERKLADAARTAGVKVFGDTP